MMSRLDAPVLIRRRTPLPRTAALLPKVDKVDTHVDPTRGFSKEEAAKDAALPPDDLVVFSDGSQAFDRKG